MPARNGDDLVLGHSAQDEFPDARVDGFSDWFVSVRFASGPRNVKVTYGHGSPFVYALYEGGGPRLTFAKPPQVWSGDEQTAVLGISVNGKHYALFGPSGSTWTGLHGKTLTNHSEGKHYFSAAILPEKSEKTLALFKQYAHVHVTDTRVNWSYDQKASEVTTTFTFTTTPFEGQKQGTLFALYPHQWRTAGDLAFHGEYPSVRGKMKLSEGTSFRTTMRFPGVLPALPNAGGADKQRLAAYVKEAVNARVPGVVNTYADGKWLGKTATLIPIAEQYGLADAVGVLRERLRKRLEQWLAPRRPRARSRTAGCSITTTAGAR